MKKVFLILVVIMVAVLGLSLSGCGGSAPLQSTLQEYLPWINTGANPLTETSVFDVVANIGVKQEKGVYTVVVKRYFNTTVTIKDKTIEKFNGFSASAQLIMENGDFQNTDALFSTNLKTQFSSFEEKTNNKYTKRITTFEKKKCTYTINTDETNPTKVVSGTIKYKDYAKEPYYDNSLIYLIARCFPTDVASYNYKIPNFDTNKLNKVVMNPEAVKQTVEFANGQTTNCRVIDIALDRTFPTKGTPYKCYISEYEMNGENVIVPPKDDDKAEPKATEGNVVNSIRAIAKIIESNVTYTLRSINSVLS